MTVSELIEVLKKMPNDSEIFVSSLCMGKIKSEQLKYDKDLNLTVFKGNKEIYEKLKS